MASEGDELVRAAVRTYVKGTAEIRITAADGLLNLRSDNRTDIWIFQKEGSPVVCKDLLDGKLGTHDITRFHFTVSKKLFQRKSVPHEIKV